MIRLRDRLALIPCKQGREVEEEEGEEEDEEAFCVFKCKCKP